MNGRCVFPNCKTIICREHNKRYCDYHKSEIKKTYMELYNGARRNYDIIKCQMCDNLFEDKGNRITCSKKCRENKWWVISNIKKRRISLKSKEKQLRELEIKYEYLL